MTLIVDETRCAYCSQQRSDLVTSADGLPLCLTCRKRARERYETETGQCYDCGYGLAFHVDDRCPAEHEARAMAGDR